MMRRIPAFLCMSLIFCNAVAAMADEMQTIIADLAEECTSIGGYFEIENAITNLDMDASGVGEIVFEPKKSKCNGAENSSWCGSGGCWVIFFSQQNKIEMLIYKWEIVTLSGNNVLVVSVRGDSCSSVPWDFCVKAFTVNADRITSVYID